MGGGGGVVGGGVGGKRGPKEMLGEGGRGYEVVLTLWCRGVDVGAKERGGAAHTSARQFKKTNTVCSSAGFFPALR